MLYRLIRHTERLLEEKEETLCIKVLQTLKEMMTIDIDYGEKVGFSDWHLHFSHTWSLFVLGKEYPQQTAV